MSRPPEKSEALARAFKDQLTGNAADVVIRLATILRSVNPEASVEDLRALLSARLPDVILPDDAVAARAHAAPTRWARICSPR